MASSASAASLDEAQAKAAQLLQEARLERRRSTAIPVGCTVLLTLLMRCSERGRAALDGMGVALGRLVRSSALVRSGQLVVLSERRLASDFNHYLVSPPRTQGHPAFEALRAWLRAEAAATAPVAS